MAPQLLCPRCDTHGEWVFHCPNNEHCVWLRHKCGNVTYSQQAQRMILRRERGRGK